MYLKVMNIRGDDMVSPQLPWYNVTMYTPRKSSFWSSNFLCAMACCSLPEGNIDVENPPWMEIIFRTGDHVSFHIYEWGDMVGYTPMAISWEMWWFISGFGIPYVQTCSDKPIERKWDMNQNKVGFDWLDHQEMWHSNKEMPNQNGINQNKVGVDQHEVLNKQVWRQYQKNGCNKLTIWT